MCAIAGIIGLNFEETTLERMLATMARRGPDGRGTYISGDTALLHTRLAIIDPQGGRQPMALNWAGETYVLVYNGELYNSEELRGELAALGHTFQGHSDTEVVLHAYAQYGAGCLDKFNGILPSPCGRRNPGVCFWPGTALESNPCSILPTKAA